MNPSQAIAPPSPLAWLAAGLLLVGAGVMMPFGDLHTLGTVPWFLLGAAILAAGYLLSFRLGVPSFWLFWGVTILARVLLLWQVPGEDIYRYVWEGRLLAKGWNPYLLAPEAPELEPLRDSVWQMVQHKTFTAIYPPLTQWLFALFSTILAAPAFFKILFALADLVVVFLLQRAFGKKNALAYAWCPLVIYSFAGGGHYDVLFVLAVVLSWLAWREGRWVAAALALGAAVATKWLAMPVVAWMIWRSLCDRGWRAACLTACFAGLPFVVSWTAVGLWTGEWTFQLLPPKFSQYARSAEFVPGVVGYFWEQSRFHNQWFLVPLAVGWGIVILRAKSFESAAQWSFFLTLILTPMLHAWYFTWLIPLAVKTRNLGILCIGVFGFVYFLLYHHVESPGGTWTLHPMESALLWLPFVVGFLFSESRRIRSF